MENTMASIENQSKRDISLDYLRATLVLMVVAHHSSLAYTTFARFNPIRFPSSPPVVDSLRWFFLDYAVSFNDVFFMSLLFCLSGIFVWPALQQYGVLKFLRQRLVRLGLPFILGTFFVMPLAYYASWQLTGNDVGYIAFWQQFILTTLIPGPLWFLWVLLLFDVIAAFVFLTLTKRSFKLADMICIVGKQRPWLIATVMFFICAFLYIPVLARFGFGTWTVFLTFPFIFQVPRLGLHFIWFLLGLLIGYKSLDKGILSKDGVLIRHWRIWIIACFIAYNLHYFVSLIINQKIGSIFWVISCVVSCFGFFALFRVTVKKKRLWMDSISRSSYAIYIVHYLFVLWLQRLFMQTQIFAGFKFIFVFIGATILSWVTAQLLLKIPKLDQVL
jgi:glucans biosynthesis protein C